MTIRQKGWHGATPQGDKMMKKSTIFLAAAVAVATAGTAYGQGRLDKIKSTGQITIGYRNASIPFSYLDGQQKPVGYSMDICRRVVDPVGRQLDMDTITIRSEERRGGKGSVST